MARNSQSKYSAKHIKYLNKIIDSEDFIEKYKKSKKDFTRTRTLSFKIVVFFLLNLLKSSLQNELDNFFKVLNGKEVPDQKATASALCQARKKLKHEIFIELNKRQVEYFYKNNSYKKWRSHRLLAIDGSTLILPRNKETIEEFGEYTFRESNTPFVQARISQMYDTLNGISIDSKISALKEGENALAIGHLDDLREEDLLLLDRGYPSFYLFKLIESKGSNFCARVNSYSWDGARNLSSSSDKEKIIDIYPSKKSITKCNKLGISKEPIRVRFIKITLNTGEEEILITSLIDRELYPYEEFADLYYERWFVEESYKLQKHRIEMERFTGKSPETIRQDFYARMFMLNLAAILSFPVHEEIKQRYKSRKKEYQINRTQALAKMKNSVIVLFFRENIEKIIKNLQDLFINNVVPIRKGRKFPRIHKPKRKYYMAYKPIS